jgi:hypothetical protein
MGAMSVTFTPQFSQTQPGLITGYLRSETMNGLTQQLTERGLPWAQVGDCLLICGDCLEVLPMLEAGSVDAVVTDDPAATCKPPRDSPTAVSTTRFSIDSTAGSALEPCGKFRS